MNLPVILPFIAAAFCLMPCRPSVAADAVQVPGSTMPNARDPFVISDSNKYFLFGAANDGFECYESADLVSWKHNGLAWRKSAMRVAKGDFRAPHVFAYRGLFYLVYSARMPGPSSLGLAASTQPQGPYHDVHVPWLSIGRSVGASVFVDHNGTAYLTFSRPAEGKGNWIYGAALSQDLSRLAGQPLKLLQAPHRTDLGRNDINLAFTSACTFRIGSKYYLTYSVGDLETLKSTIAYASADDPLGPWSIGESPLLSSRSGQPNLSVGHVSVFRTVDRKNWLLGYQNSEPAPRESGVAGIEFQSLSLDGIRRLVMKDSRSDPR
jgi:beta-xylosidase